MASWARAMTVLVCCCAVLPAALQVVWVFRVQDTPGYGDDQDISRHIGMIIQHINSQNTKWLDMESARDRCAGDVATTGAAGFVCTAGLASAEQHAVADVRHLLSSP
jgi:hypothetical protein